MGFKLGQTGTTRDRAVMALMMFTAAVAVPRDADACGACYGPANESTIVNDHRMALSIGKQQTILWDQISYSGNPKEFAYVLPARPGTRIEPSSDAWFGALDASTRPIIMGPPQYGGGGYGSSGYSGGNGGGDNGGGGCCSSSETTSAFSAGAADASAGSSGSSGAAPGAEREPVEVVEQKVVGPYETITVRSTEPEALDTWLREHGFAIPEQSGPIIADYVKNGFDFIALRLRPASDVRAIEPIRIVAPGADPTLPLRLMQIGAGANLGITLWVIGEGRWHTKNFPDAVIDFSKLIWDSAKSRSNYQELSFAAMAKENGRAILTEYADRPNLNPNAPQPQPGQMANVGLASAYRVACVKQPLPPVRDAGPLDAGAPDASPEDAGDDAEVDGGDLDGGDGGASDASVPPVVETNQCDDLEIALDSLNGADVMITRLRAKLPYAALNDTMILEPTADQGPIDNVHQANTNGTIQGRIARVPAPRQFGTYAVVAVTALVVARILGKRKPKNQK